MKILISKRGGYCYGGQRALKIANEAAEGTDEPIHTLGPIIHNPGVVRELAAAGSSPVDDLAGVERGIIILSTQGFPLPVFVESASRGRTVACAHRP